jgi:hypothetical protein
MEQAGLKAPWNALWNHKPAQPGETGDLRDAVRDVCPAREAGATEQATLNPLVQGSTPWRPTTRPTPFGERLQAHKARHTSRTSVPYVIFVTFTGEDAPMFADRAAFGSRRP